MYETFFMGSGLLGGTPLWAIVGSGGGAIG